MSEKPKFTPGPWEKKFNSLRVQQVKEPKLAICYTDTFGTSGQSEWNARLIAAAPIGYELAEMVIAGFGGQFLLPQSQKNMLTKAREFMRVAKGE